MQKSTSLDQNTATSLDKSTAIVTTVWYL